VLRAGIEPRIVICLQSRELGSKVKKKAGIEPKMVNSLQLRERGVQNTIAVYPWFLASIFNEFTPAHSTVNKSTY